MNYELSIPAQNLTSANSYAGRPVTWVSSCLVNQGKNEVSKLAKGQDKKSESDAAGDKSECAVDKCCAPGGGA